MGVMKQWERKSGVRFTAHVDLGGSATLFRKDGAKLGSYLVQDLTSRGALLTGDGDVTRAGRVHVMLALPSQPEPMMLWGHVDRVAPGGLGLVGVELRFAGLSADQEDAIEDAILEEWSRLRS